MRVEKKILETESFVNSCPFKREMAGPGGGCV